MESRVLLVPDSSIVGHDVGRNGTNDELQKCAKVTQIER